MTQEQEDEQNAILEEVKRRYPIGCLVKALNGRGHFYDKEDKVAGTIRIYADISNKSTGLIIDASFTAGFLYVKGKWAEVVAPSLDNYSIYN